MIKIEKRIVGYSVVAPEKTAEQEAPKDSANDASISTVAVPVDTGMHEPELENVGLFNMDIDPTGDSRPTPDGFVDAVRYKQRYVDPKGNRQSLYIVVGFERRKAMKDGVGFVIEHPVEVFAPAKEQIADTAAMVLASRCLRSGTLPSDVVNDFLSVQLPENYWVKTPNGKQKMVHSMSAVIGEAIKAVLIHRGIMDEYGADVPYDQRPRIGEPSFPFNQSFHQSQSVGAARVSEPKQQASGFRSLNQTCPDCGADEWVIKDGCPTCSCGYSKCG